MADESQSLDALRVQQRKYPADWLRGQCFERHGVFERCLRRTAASSWREGKKSASHDNEAPPRALLVRQKAEVETHHTID